jgi:hypothetical protein
VLAEIRAAVITSGLNRDPFKARLNKLDEDNPRDRVVEALEYATHYANPITEKMIKATDDLINETVENECPDTSTEEDDDEPYDVVNRAVDAILALPKERLCISAKNIDFIRFEILKGILHNEFPEDLLGGPWRERFRTFTKKQYEEREAKAQEALEATKRIWVPPHLRGGTKRRKSKKKKRTKRKLK